MRYRTVMVAAALLVAASFVSGCKTVAKVGHALSTVGHTIAAVGDVLTDGAAGDMADGMSVIGFTAPPPVLVE